MKMALALFILFGGIAALVLGYVYMYDVATTGTGFAQTFAQVFLVLAMLQWIMLSRRKPDKKFHIKVVDETIKE